MLLLFVVVPTVELALLIEVGGRMGLVPTMALIFVTGVIGASLARHQGLGVLRSIQDASAEGRVPASEMADGVIILIAAAVLLTPGILTDLFGFMCLVPQCRAVLKRLVWQRLERAVVNGQAQVVTHAPHGGGPVYDITPEPDDREG